MSHSLLTKMKTVIYMPEALRSVYHQSEFYYNIINIIRDYMYYNIFCLLYCIKYFDVGIFARGNQLPTLHVIVKEYPTMQCIILEFSGILSQR